MLPLPGFLKAGRDMYSEFPFKYARIENLGTLFYPLIRLELKTITGWQEFEFLVDTGADVTTVPVHLLPVLGIKKSSLSVSNTLGVGGISVKTWELNMPIKLGGTVISVRASAVESKHDSMPLLLGRKDIFEEKFNLIIDSRKKVTIIKKN